MPLLGEDELRAAMAADVGVAAQCAVLVAQEDDGEVAEGGGEEVAGVGQFFGEADVLPGAAEDAVLFAAVERLGGVPLGGEGFAAFERVAQGGIAEALAYLGDVGAHGWSRFRGGAGCRGWWRYCRIAVGWRQGGEGRAHSGPRVNPRLSACGDEGRLRGLGADGAVAVFAAFGDRWGMRGAISAGKWGRRPLVMGIRGGVFVGTVRPSVGGSIACRRDWWVRGWGGRRGVCRGRWGR